MRIAFTAVVLGFFLGLTSVPGFAGYAVQVGAFANPHYAMQAKAALENAGFGVIQSQSGTIAPSKLTTLLTGPYSTLAEAERARVSLAKAGFSGYVRRFDNRNIIVQPGTVSTADSASKVNAAPVIAKPLEGELLPLKYFAAADPFAPTEPTPSSASKLPVSINGYVQNEVAYTVAAPDHWSKFRNVAELAVKKALTADINLKVSGRFWYDGVYDFTTFYPERVKRDQRFEAMFRETYLDASAGNWNFRLGRQQIVWGEVVGLFFADVVSAKDLREIIIPELGYIRTPQWATRAEYFIGDFKAEAIWIPYMSYDSIGKPGGDFYPSPIPPPPGFREVIRNERMPHQWEDSGFGARVSYLVSGWDLGGFYYSSTDSSATFFRRIKLAPTPTFVYQPDHDRIHQIGGTLSKDLSSFVLRAEAVYTFDKWFNVTRLNDANGVVRQDFLDYIVGLDFPLPADFRFNVQFFQRWFPEHDRDMIPRRVESGASLLLSTKLFNDRVEPELLTIHSLNRLDWFTRFKVTWRFAENWRAVAGTAFLGGKKTGLFGQFDNSDRVFTELRYAF